MIFNLKNTVSQFKRLIGRKFSDPVVEDEKRRLPCQLVENPGDCIGVKVRFKPRKKFLFAFEMFTGKELNFCFTIVERVCFSYIFKRINFFHMIMRFSINVCM